MQSTNVLVLVAKVLVKLTELLVKLTKLLVLVKELFRLVGASTGRCFHFCFWIENPMMGIPDCESK